MMKMALAQEIVQARGDKVQDNQRYYCFKHKVIEVT